MIFPVANYPVAAYANEFSYMTAYVDRDFNWRQYVREGVQGPLLAYSVTSWTTLDMARVKKQLVLGSKSA